MYTYNGEAQTYQLTKSSDYTISSNTIQTDANEDGYEIKVKLKDKTNTKWAGEGGDTTDKTYRFIIKKAAVTVTAKDQSGYVDAAVPVLGADSYTVSGLIGCDTLTTLPTLKYADAEGNEITPDMTKTGDTIIRASGADAGNNYEITTYIDGKLTVSARLSSGNSSSSSSSVADAAIRAIKNAKPGETVTIDMKGETKMPAKVLDVAYGKDIPLNFNMGGGTVWSVNGLDIPKGGVALNLGIKTGTKNIPVKLINAITGEVSNVQLQLSHSGEFGLTLTLFLDLGKEFDGLFANLYYYNDKADALEFQNSCKISGGTASWPFDHASEYAIVIDKVNHDAARFSDVAENAYYAGAVKWALQRGITGGGKFSPNATCTREQAVPFLYRASGSPAVSGGSAFSDVAASAYYAKAVAWAEKNGVTGGIGNGKFSTGSDCTRAQIVTFLYRAYQGK